MAITIESQIQSLLDIIEYLLIKLNEATVFEIKNILEESVGEIVAIKNSLSEIPETISDEHWIKEKHGDHQDLDKEETSVVVVKIDKILNQVDDDIEVQADCQRNETVSLDLEDPWESGDLGKIETVEEDDKEPQIIPYSFIRNLANETEVSSVCNLCGKIYRSRSKMKDHIRRYHDNNVIQCILCFKELIGKKRFKDHMRNHTGKVKCNVCNKFFVERTIKQHMLQCLETPSLEEKQIKIKRTKNNYRCPICDFVFTNKKKFLAHKKVHFKCQDCDKSFKKQKTLDRHRNSIHNANVPMPKPDPEKIAVIKYYYCDQCQYMTKRKRTLKRHFVTHTKSKAIVEQEKDCKMCGHQFRNHYNLKRHREFNKCKKDESHQDKTFILTWTGN